MTDDTIRAALADLRRWREATPDREQYLLSALEVDALLAQSEAQPPTEPTEWKPSTGRIFLQPSTEPTNAEVHAAALELAEYNLPDVPRDLCEAIARTMLAAAHRTQEEPTEGVVMAETAEAQIDRLAQFIMDEVPGEPSQSQGAVDTAIRLLAQPPTEPTDAKLEAAWEIEELLVKRDCFTERTLSLFDEYRAHRTQEGRNDG